MIETKARVAETVETWYRIGNGDSKGRGGKEANGMRVKTSEIRAELRFGGAMLRLMLPHFTRGLFRLGNRCLDAFVKGRWRGKRTRMHEAFVSRADGSKLRLCVCFAASGTKKDAVGLLWLHGGGFAMGVPEQGHRRVDAFAGEGDCVVVLPDYTRSTEAPYPAAAEDCYLALLWMKAHAAALGVNADQLFVGGESAGGGLTAAVCLMARDRGEASVAFGMPLYPMLDDRMTSDSMLQNNAPVWNAQSNAIAWRMYLGERFGSDCVSKYAAPARETDASDLPPMCTFIGTIEPFYDETLAYASALEQAGVSANVKVFPGCFHAFDILFWKSAAAREAQAFLMDAFLTAKGACRKAQPTKADSI